MDEDGTLTWRRDASTSTLIRLGWSLGVGTLLAAIGLVIFARLFEFTGEIGGQTVVVAALLAVALTILAVFAVTALGNRSTSLANAIPGVDADSIDGEVPITRALDASLGAVVMGLVIGGFVRFGGDAGQALAAATIPLALVVLVLVVFTRSTGALDTTDGVLYRYDTEEAIALEDLESASVYRLGDNALVRLRYHQPDNVYVPGPRWLTVPATVGRQLERQLAES